VLLGDGLFETVLSRAGVTFRLGAHLARLAAGARSLGIPMPVPVAEVPAAVNATLGANSLDNGDAIVRITLTRGPGTRGLLPPAKPSPVLIVTATPHTVTQADTVSTCIVAPRRNELSPTCSLKTLNYLDNILAAQEATLQGCDEGLMLNSRNRFSGGARSNLFMVLDGVLYTPGLDDGALPGIVRGVVLEMAKVLRLKHRQASIFVYDVPRASEAFMTNSIVGILPIARIGQQRIGEGTVGPVTAALIKGYTALLAANRP
jgi:branched-chain amino acid aminotransferase